MFCSWRTKSRQVWVEPGNCLPHQHEDVRPDVTIIGKALAGGFYPVSAVLSDKQVLGLFTPGEHGSTFGGNPLAAAIARAALKVIVEENLCQRAAGNGRLFHRAVERNSQSTRQGSTRQGLTNRR